MTLLTRHQGASGLATPTESPELLEWLHGGRLTLVEDGQALSADDWDELPEHVRANALEDFQRVVRGRAKAAVIFLRD